MNDCFGGLEFSLECCDPTHETCATIDGDERIMECFLLPWFDELGTGMLACDGWPDDLHFPLPVTWVGDGDNPEIVFAERTP